MEQATKAKSSSLPTTPVLPDEWIGQFRAKALSCGLSGRVYIALFEPQSRCFVVVASLGGEQTQPYLLSAIPPGSLDRLTSGHEAVVAASAWPTGAEHDVVMFPLTNNGSLYGAACVETQVCTPDAEQLDGLREACAAALQQLAPADAPGLDMEIRELRSHLTELSARSEMKSRALAHLLHELRSPLVSVRGYTRLVLEGRAGPLSTPQHEYLNVVAENANRMVTAINHAAQLNPDTLALGVVDLLGLWRASVARILPLAQQKGIRIVEQASEGCWDVVIDCEGISQVIDALLDNSVKFAGQNGEIVGQFAYSDETTLTLRISDSGPGIPAGLMEKMFDRYYQAETAMAGEQADVRLPLVYDIVRQHGGRLSVSSTDGEGCSFALELPAIHAYDPGGFTHK